jgi:hypothetical protein
MTLRLAAVILIAAAVTTAGPPTSPWVGEYRCQGEATSGKSYEADLTIVSRGSFYELTWTVHGQPVSVGAGAVIGDTLSVAFVLREAFGHAGYRRARDGHLEGRWVGFGEWVENWERCVRKDVTPAE